MDNNIKDDNPSLNKDSALEQQNNMESIKQEILPELTKLQNNVFLQYILDEQTNSFALIYSEKQNLINYLSDGLFGSGNNKKLDIILYKLLLQNISYISPLYTPSFNTGSIFYTGFNPEAEEDIAWDNLKKQVETTNPAQRSGSLRYLYTNKDKDITTVLKEIQSKEQEELTVHTNIQQELNDLQNDIESSPETEPSSIGDIFSNTYNKISNTAKGIIKTAKAKIDNATNNIEILFEKIANSGAINEIKNRITEHIPFNDNEAKEISDTYNQLQGKEKPEFLPFCLAMKGFNAKKSNLKNQKYLTIVDFSKKENEKRLYVINLETKSVEHITQCGIGKGSNGNESGFGNTNGSNKTSLGFYETKDMLRDNTRNTRGGIGLFIIGIEKSNDLAVRRGIAIHPVITLRNRSGVSTSEGCLTIPKYTTPKTEIEEILNSIKGDSLVFAYYPSLSYLQQSKLLNPHNK